MPADLFAFVCGLTTSLLTGALLWWIAATFGLAIHKMTLWLVIPGGAFLAGWAGASGYYLAYHFSRRRPGPLLVPGVLAASVGAFSLTYILAYVTLKADGVRMSDTVPFSTFLDLAIRASFLRLEGTPASVQLGYFGYMTTLLEVLGFAVGGLVVCVYLRAQPYCDRCSRRLDVKLRQVRYAPTDAAVQAIAREMLDSLRDGSVRESMEQHQKFGSVGRYRNSQRRSVCELQDCPHCRGHVVRYALEQLFREFWIPVTGWTTEAFTDKPVSLPRKDGF